MRPGSSALVRAAPTRTRPARGLGESTPSELDAWIRKVGGDPAPRTSSSFVSGPDGWRLTPDEQDGYLTKRPLWGGTVSILKSRLFSMSYADMTDDPEARQFSSEYDLRMRLLEIKANPEVLKDPVVGPLVVEGMAPGLPKSDYANQAGTPIPTKSFVLGKCPAEDAMGWPLVPDSIQHAVCVVTHVALGVLSLAAVIAAVWAIDTAGKAAGD